MSSIWFDAAPDRRRHPILESSVEADVVVIGGGIAGAMAAWQASREGASVVLLEQGHLGTGDTGYTTAMLTRVPDAHAADLAKRYGAAFLARVFEANAAAQKEVIRLIREEGIDCDLKEIPTYFFSYRKDDPALRAEWEALRKADPRATLVTDLSETGNPKIAAAVRYDGEARFHARKFVIGLMEKAVAGGAVRVFEESGALSYAFDPAGVMVKTEKGEVRAKRMVAATGMPPAPFRDVQALLTPRVSYVVSGKLKTEGFVDANFWDTDEPYNYFRRVDDHGTFVYGGGDRDGAASIDLKDAEAELRGHMAKLGLEADIDRTWSGGLYYTSDGLPYAGAVPGRAQAGIATGFGGNGMVMGALSGMIAGAYAAGKAHPYADVFSFARNGADRKMKPAAAKGLPTWRWLFPLAYLAVLVVPGWVFFTMRGGLSFLDGLEGAQLRLLTFPLVGLYAFTMLWAQAMIGSSMPILRGWFPWAEKAHRAHGAFVLLLALTHPLLLITGLGFSEYLALGFVAPENKAFVLLGDLQLLLLIVTVGTAVMMKAKWLKTRWHLIHLANYAVFAMVWTHSWFLGSDVRTTPLRWLWLFFAATFAASAASRLLRARRGPPAMAGQWRSAATLAELEEAKGFCATVDGREIALFRVGAAVHALDNACTHAGGPLCRGAVKDGEVECPWHQSRFALATGAVAEGPAARPQPRYETRVRDGVVEIKL